MNINQELVEKVKAGTHCIEMPDKPIPHDIELMRRIITLVEGVECFFEGCNKYYGNGWDGDSLILSTPIYLSSFLLPTPKTIPVEELEAVISQEWSGYNQLKDGIQNLINKYK